MRKIKSILIIWVISVLLLGAAASAIADDNDISNSNELTEIAKGLDSGDWLERAKAARYLSTIENNDPIEIVVLLVEGIEDEINSPFSEEKPIGNYMTVTELLKREYTFALGKIGSRGAQQLHVEKDTASAETQRWLILALGLQIDESVYSDVKEILSSDTNGYLRTLAARVLGEYGNPDAITVLRNALTDPFKVQVHSDFIRPGKEFVYPVRNEAAGSLRRLGITVKRDGLEYRIEQD